MTPDKILSLLWGHGFHVNLTVNDSLKVSPSSTLDPNLRELILANKGEIVELLKNARDTTVALVEAAMKRCDQFNDSEAQRAEMRQDIEDTPPHLQQDLLDYFLSNPPT